jgi:hypothetical protein
VSGDEASSRSPGLVARLMGLESLPEAPVASKHRRSRSFSGSESASHSEKDIRGAKLALRDLLKQEHEPFENYALATVAVEHKEQKENRGRKAAVHTPIKTLVPYVDSPTGSCRSVYALPYVHKGEKSPFLARLHPSPVLQPSKCHNQMVSPAKTTSPATKKRASRFLEAAVKILEEISDNEQCFPREREGMRSIAEFAASSPLSSGTDLLHCRSMRKIWNGSEDTDSISNRSFSNRGSMSFRDSQRRDRICRDIFETSLSERAQSASPPPRRPPRTKAASPAPQETVKERGRILRTQEAAVVDFKTDVRKANSMSSFPDSVRYLQQTAAPRRRSLHSKASAGLEDSDFVTSDEESLTDQLVRLASTGAAAPKTTGRSSFRKSPRRGASMSMSSSVGDLKVQSIVRREEAIAPSPQVRSASLHEGLRPIRLPRKRGGQQENAVRVSSSRTLSSEFAKPRSALSSPSHSRQFSGQMEELKLSVRVKREEQVRGAAAGAELFPAAPAAQCPLPNASSLKRLRRKSRHESPKLRESSGHARGGESRRTPPLQTERRKYLHNAAARNPTRARGSAEQTVDAVALPDSQNDGHEVAILDVETRDENVTETADSAPSLHGHEKVEHVQGPARDLFPSPEVAECCSDVEELLILGMDDLHWDDGMVAQQRENSSRARYCETRASGESVHSICGALDEDVCNVDDGSSPSPQKVRDSRPSSGVRGVHSFLSASFLTISYLACSLQGNVPKPKARLPF